MELTTENIRTCSRFHPRCGTSFLLIVVLVSILVNAALPWSNLGLRARLQAAAFARRGGHQLRDHQVLRAVRQSRHARRLRAGAVAAAHHDERTRRLDDRVRRRRHPPRPAREPGGGGRGDAGRRVPRRARAAARSGRGGRRVRRAVPVPRGVRTRPRALPDYELTQAQEETLRAMCADRARRRRSSTSSASGIFSTSRCASARVCSSRVPTRRSRRSKPPASPEPRRVSPSCSTWLRGAGPSRRLSRTAGSARATYRRGKIR